MSRVCAEQLEFNWRDAPQLQQQLETLLGYHVQVTITDNSSSIITFRKHAAGMFRVRLHHMFLMAPDHVLAALASWMKNPKRSIAGQVVDSFIKDHQELIQARTRRITSLRPSGKYYNLQEIFDRLNEEEFGNKVNASITWGKKPSKRRRRRSIRFGSYSEHASLIRIHPALDSDRVPEFFVRYIVFHEMLHAFLGVSSADKKVRRIHTREFRDRERLYADYEKALMWQNNSENLAFLLKG